MKTCDLPGCNKQARRRFCCNKHKDRYHNLNNPRGRYAHLAREEPEDAFGLMEEADNDEHPFSSDALGQW